MMAEQMTCPELATRMPDSNTYKDTSISQSQTLLYKVWNLLRMVRAWSYGNCHLHVKIQNIV